MSVSHIETVMKYLDTNSSQNFSSILASLSGTGQTSSTSAPARPPIPKTTLTPTTAAAKPPSQSTQPSTSLKRKAEETCTGLPPKIQRSEVATPSTKSAGMVGAGSAKQQISRPAQDPKSQPTTANAEVAANAGVQSTRPPPKGSFREILARAEAAKAKQSEFGHIKHKALEKPSRKERRIAQEAAAAAKAKDGQKQRNGTKVALHKQPRPGKQLAQRPRKTAAELGYTGTMRPSSSQPAYKGTMKPSTSATSRPTSRGPGGLPSESRAHEGRYRYASYSDEEEDEEDDESDMEAAGFDELEEEEQQSLRAAKKEDEEALRQENEHRRQKAEKRKKLEQLAAARRR